ncbi:putative bifunctional diguanylate cyclase/phosphodiesterase [Hoeflea sp.]|uniref:putative bifunctional diguanylate cyclase/phosphodiesterase n=1 Tax=Hoeflea sp. TaxID=1940281 RepID=UPI00374818C8
MRSVFNTFNLFGLGVVAAFLAIVVVHTNLVEATENAVERSSRFDVAWVGAGGRLEAYALQTSLARYALTGSPEDASRARLFTEIVVGRFGVFDTEAFRAFVDSKPARRARLDEAISRFDRILPELKRIETRGQDRTLMLLSEFEQVLKAIDRVGAEAHAEAVNQAAKNRRELRDKQSLQKWLATILFMLIALLLGLAAIQNRFLGKANKKALRAAKDFSYLAHHDSLTSLPNRMAFNNKFEALVTQCANSGQQQIAVLAIDLDGFKDINDRLGHASGDALLVEVAKRMSEACASLPNGIMAARIGGDEFVIILDATEYQDDIALQADFIRRRITRPHSVSGNTLLVGATIGFAINAPGEDPHNLLVDADMALSQAKSDGKSRVVGFNPAMRDGFLRHALIEAELGSAIENGDIRPHYQIKMDMASGQVVGVEALARWHHPELGQISPAEFVPIAESSEHIVSLGRKILERACIDTLSFPGRLNVSVNLSVRQFARDDVVKTVREVLQATNFPAEQLTLEVTESLMICDANNAIQVLTELKALGVSIALDDFGTGYSALSYLQRFEWDELKIDRSFVVEIEGDKRARAVIGSITSLARKLGIPVTAEGTETVGQVEALRRAGCNTLQGFYFGRPVPMEELSASILNGISAAARFGSTGQTAAQKQLRRLEPIVYN